MLKCLDPVSEPRGLLVAEVLGEMLEPPPKACERAAFEKTIELVRRARRKGACCERRSPAAGDRAELGLGLRDDEIIATALEVEAGRLPPPARVGRRIELADQSQLVERGLELRTLHTPFDPIEGKQGRLDGGSLPLASEVGPEAGAQ